MLDVSSENRQKSKFLSKQNSRRNDSNFGSSGSVCFLERVFACKYNELAYVTDDRHIQVELCQVKSEFSWIDNGLMERPTQIHVH